MKQLLVLPLLTVLVTASGLAQLGGAPPVATLSFDAREFKQAFNGAADRVRLVLVFSPT